jgi:hypothetical protein
MARTAVLRRHLPIEGAFLALWKIDTSKSTGLLIISAGFPAHFFLPQPMHEIFIDSITCACTITHNI